MVVKVILALIATALLYPIALLLSTAHGGVAEAQMFVANTHEHCKYLIKQLTN